MKGPGTAVLALLTALGLLLLSGCQGFGNLDQPPVAKFTVMNQSGESVLRVGERVVLDASESNDPQGYPLTYEWKLDKAGASSGKLSSSLGKTVFFYPDVASTDLFFVSLRVTARIQSDITQRRPLSVVDMAQGKLRLTTDNGPGGSVDPWGVRAVMPDIVFPLTATPDKGYEFDKWVVSGTGSANIVDVTKPQTSATLSSGPVTIQALFRASAVLPSFLGWKSAFPNGLTRVNGITGAVSLVGDGSFSGQMVSLARASDGLLYGAGTPITNLRGDQLFVIDPVTGMAGPGVDFKSGGVSSQVLSLASTPAGTVYALEKASSRRLSILDLRTASLLYGQDLLDGVLPVDLKSLTYSVDAVSLLGTDGTNLYQVKSSGAVTKIGSFGISVTLSSLTGTKDGRLFALDDTVPSSLYSIDPTSGKASLVMTLGMGLMTIVVEPN